MKQPPTKPERTENYHAPNRSVSRNPSGLQVPMFYRECVITLVHGTFAPNAGWVADRSTLQTFLSEQLAAEVRFRSFPWTGGNSHADRRKAGQELCSFLTEGIALHPSAKHFIIAHSHGANVALYAVAKTATDIGRRVSGLVTMAAPFLHVAPRDLHKGFRVLDFAVPLCVCYVAVIPTSFLTLFLGGMVVGILGLLGVPVEYRMAAPLTIPFFLILMLGIWRWTRSLLRNRAYRWAEAMQKSALLTLAVPAPVDLPMLCLSIRGDEAAWWLGRLYRAAAFPFGLWRMRLFVGFYLVLFAALAYTLSTDIDLISETIRWWWLGALSGWVRIVLGAAFFSALALAAVLIVLQLLMAMIPRVVRAPRFGFGGETISDNWFMDINVKKEPCGGNRAKITTYDSPTPVWELITTAQLRHSTLYADKAVLSDVVVWIDTLLAYPGASTEPTDADVV